MEVEVDPNDSWCHVWLGVKKGDVTFDDSREISGISVLEPREDCIGESYILHAFEIPCSLDKEGPPQNGCNYPYRYSHNECTSIIQAQVRQ
jgi:hypothetical protein